MGPPAPCLRCHRRLVGEGSIALRVPGCRMRDILGQSGGAAPWSDYLYKARGRRVALGLPDTLSELFHELSRGMSVIRPLCCCEFLLRCCKLFLVDLETLLPLIMLWEGSNGSTFICS